MGNSALAKREDTFTRDIEAIWVRLEHAKEPDPIVARIVKDMNQGKFNSDQEQDPEIEKLAKKHKIDELAKVKLYEALAGRADTQAKDLKDLDERLEWCGTPSALLMSLLKKLVKGDPLPSSQQKPQPGSYLDRQAKAAKQKKDNEQKNGG